MAVITFCDLREKEIINIFDGKKLGRIIDMTLDESGQILTIFVPGDRSFFKNLTQDPLTIEWCKIIKIGVDTILVDLCDI